MEGREDKKSNDLFYTCSLIAFIARKTKNTPCQIVNALGRENIAKIYDLADVYHCDSIDRVSSDFIAECSIKDGCFNNIAKCKYSVPTYWDIGKIYKRLVLMIAKNEQIDITDALIKAYNSKASNLIEDYNSSFYYDNPQNIYSAYKELSAAS